MKPIKLLSVAFLLFALTACDQGTATEPGNAKITNGETKITPAQAKQSYANARFVDVRTNAEWNAGHLASAVHLPLSEIAGRAQAVLGEPSEPLLLYCKRGVRAERASQLLQQLGYQTIVVTDGGYAELVATGLASSTTAGR